MQPSRRVLAAVLAAALGASLPLLPPQPASAATGSATANGIERVNLTETGAQTMGDSFPQDLSADGRHVLYTTQGRLWTLDRTTGQRVQQDAGATSGTYTQSARMSPNGRWVAFASDRAYGPNDTNGFTDVYVRDRDADGNGTLDEAGGTSLELVSVAPGSTTAARGSEPRISANGNVVTWHGPIPTGGMRIWLRDRAAGTTEAVGNGALYAEHDLSGDGQLVAWINYPNSEGLNVYPNERALFVTTRGSATKTRLGILPGGRDTYPITPVLSPDGRYVAFSSYENDVVVADTGFDEDLFVYDRSTSSWQAVNVTSTGSGGTGRTSQARFSTDSSHLTFVSTDSNIVTGDSNGFDDVFLRSLGPSPVTTRVAMGLAGAQPNDYLSSGAVSDGAAFVLFGGRASNLVTGDTNGTPDVFLRSTGDTPPPPVQHTLTVTVDGTGTGAVSSAPAGISCPPTCSAAFDEGTSVTLTATPTAPSTFSGFSGACAGATCTVSMTAARSVTATFAAPPPNQAPTAGDDSYDATEDTALVVAAPGVLDDDTDPEGGALTATVSTQPAHGTLTLAANGGFTYTPTAGFTGADSFTYTATDPAGAADTATVTVAVAPPVPAETIVWSRQNGGLWTGGPGRSPQLLLSGAAYDPSWSPDRSYVVFASDREGGQSDLWVVSADGTGLHKLTDDAASDGDPAWSPDGTRIAFMSNAGGDYDIYSVLVDGSRRTQLTDNDGTFDNAPAWSPDGSRITWSSGFDIWTMDADGSDAGALVLAGGMQEGPSWSPDGLSIAYSNHPAGSDPRLRIVDVDGTDDRPVDTGMWSHSPSWSPDGRYLAFTATVAGETETWVVAPNGSGLSNVSRTPGNDLYPDWGQPPYTPNAPPTATDDDYDATRDTALVVAAPGALANDSDPEDGALTATVTSNPSHGTVVLAPDGSFTYTPAAGYTGGDSFTYAVTDPAGGSDSGTVTIDVAAPPPTEPVVWANLNGGIWKGVPGGTPALVLSGQARSPSWSPDRSQVVFSSDRGGQDDLWVVGSDGTGLRQLTADATGDSDPAWSPDGTRIAFTCDDGDLEICTISPSGSSRTQLTRNSTYELNPAWSPDGSKIVFRSGLDLWTMRYDGTSSALIVSTPNEVSSDPSWSPDGTEIAFTNQGFGGDDPDIRIVTVASGTTRTYPAPLWSFDPSWSVDGSHLAFVVYDNGGYETFVGALDGSGQRSISSTVLGNDMDPDWGRTPVEPPGLPKSLGVLVSGPTSVVQGEAHLYTFTVHNGGSTSAAGVVLQTGAGAPGFTQPVSGTSTTQGSCSTVTTCQLGTIAPGATVTVTSTVTMTIGADIEVQAQVSCSCTDPISTDNRAALPVTVTAKVDLTLTWTTAAPSGPGQPIAWTSTVQGLSGARVPTLVVDYDIPAGVTITATTFPAGSPPGSCQVLATVVRCTWSPASGTPRVVIYGVPQGGGSYVMTGHIVECSCIDPNLVNNHVACPAVNVRNTADLSITKTVAGQPPYAVGDVVGWTVRVANAGPDAATGTRVLDTMPTGFGFVSATPSQGTCSFKKTSITCELGSVPAGGAATVLVRLRATSAQTGAVNSAQTWCDCWEVSSSPSNSVSAAPVRIQYATPPVAVTPCAQFTTMGHCVLVLRVTNPNGTTLPAGGTVEIGPLDPTNGPRLLWDATFPTGITCVDLGTVIRCTLPAVSTNGLTFNLPLLLTGTGGTWNGTVTWSCGCVPSGTGSSVTTVVPPLGARQSCIGGQVLFHSDASRDEDVYAARLDGSGWTNLTNNTVTDEADAVWSPDGRHFVFNRGYAESENRRLYIADLDASGCIDRVRKVAGQPNADNYQADWSADGARLAFVSKLNGQHDIYTIGVDGSGLTRVTSHAADERAPSFRDDGQRIAFVRNNGTRSKPNWDILTVRSDGTSESFVGAVPGTGYASSGADYSPTYSRGLDGGDRIIWHSNYGSRDWDLWSMAGDGTGKQKISGYTSLDEKNAEWSDNGEKVVYDAGTGTSGIWIMNRDGSGRVRIALTGGIDQAPSIRTTAVPPYPCGTLSESGGTGVTTRTTQMGQTSGSFVLEYQTYSVPDLIEVIYQGATIWSTGGYVADHSSIAIPYNGSESLITVRVTGNATSSTMWWYRVDCPT